MPLTGVQGRLSDFVRACSSFDGVGGTFFGMPLTIGSTNSLSVTRVLLSLAEGVFARATTVGMTTLLLASDLEDIVSQTFCTSETPGFSS